MHSCTHHSPTSHTGSTLLVDSLHTHLATPHQPQTHQTGFTLPVHTCSVDAERTAASAAAAAVAAEAAADVAASMACWLGPCDKCVVEVELWTCHLTVLLPCAKGMLAGGALCGQASWSSMEARVGDGNACVLAPHRLIPTPFGLGPVHVAGRTAVVTEALSLTGGKGDLGSRHKDAATECSRTVLRSNVAAPFCSRSVAAPFCSRGVAVPAPLPRIPILTWAPVPEAMVPRGAAPGSSEECTGTQGCSCCRAGVGHSLPPTLPSLPLPGSRCLKRWCPEAWPRAALMSARGPRGAAAAAPGSGAGRGRRAGGLLRRAQAELGGSWTRGGAAGGQQRRGRIAPCGLR